jgi:hypothetical protein
MLPCYAPDSANIALLEMKGGVMAMLDEECTLPKGSEAQSVPRPNHLRSAASHRCIMRAMPLQVRR